MPAQKVLSIDSLPVVLTKRSWSKKPLSKLTREDRKDIASIVYLVEEIIYPTNQKAAKIIQAGIKAKRAEGYCGGFLTCLNYTGPDVYMCHECKRKKENPRYHRRSTEYGDLMKAKREMAKKSKMRGYSR